MKDFRLAPGSEMNFGKSTLGRVGRVRTFIAKSRTFLAGTNQAVYSEGLNPNCFLK